jgi:lipoate-protein ligase A
MHMARDWRLLTTPAAKGAWNMAVDEVMLEEIARHGGPASLRLYAWSPPCLSLGYSQPYADVDEDRLVGRGWDVVRRPTGGRAILHTDELTYSIVSPANEGVVSGSLMDSYDVLAGALLHAVRLLGINAEAKARAEPARSSANPVCFEVSSAHEITVEGKKLVGSAQARRKGAVLQHGSLPLTGDLGRITQVLVFDDETTRRDSAARLLGCATTVESALGLPVPWSAAAEAMIQGFGAALGLRFDPAALSEREERRAAELVEEKYGHASWTRRA